MQIQQEYVDQDSESDSNDSSSISEESQDEKLQPYKSQNPKDAYDRSDWVKISYRNEIKRVYNPPKTIKEFVETLKRRYPSLPITLTQNENAQIYLSYCDSDDDEIEVEDTRELLEAYRYGHLKKKKHVLKFNVNVFTKANEEEEILRQRSQQVNFQQFLNTSTESIEYYEPKFGQEEEQQFGQNKEEEKKEEIQMVEVPIPKQKGNEPLKRPEDQKRERKDSQNNFSQAVQQQKQQKPLFEKLYPEVNVPQNPFLASQNDPSLSQIQPQKEGAIQKNEQVEVLIGVNLVQCRDPAYLKNQEQVKQHKSLWTKVVGFLKAEPEVSAKRKDLARLLSNQQSYTTGFPPTDVRLQWVIQNQTQVPWDQGSILRNLNSKEVIVKPVRIAKVLKPGEIIEVRIDVFLPKGINSDKVILMFQLENEQKKKFGDVMIGIIDIQYPGKKVQNVEDSSYQHFDPSFLIKEDFNQNEEILYNKASILSDSGFGSFELCYNVLKACKGNELQAKKELSNMIFKQHKRQ